MNKGMLHNFSAERFQFLGCRQFSPKDEISHFQEGTFLSEYLNWVPTIFKDAAVTVNERDSRSTCNGVHVARIICSQDLTFMCEFSKVSRFDVTSVGVELGSLTSAGVSDSDRVLLGHLLSQQIQPIHQDIILMSYYRTYLTQTYLHPIPTQIYIMKLSNFILIILGKKYFYASLRICL